MIAIERVTAQNILSFRDARLHALQDTPWAFGSTYAREAQLTEAEWLERAKRWDTVTGILYIAADNGLVCGMAGSFLDEKDATLAQLISMWTASTHRQKGIGKLLVNKIIDWARGRGARTLQLMVTSVNDGGILFYERLGFVRTGRTSPYPNDPAILEYEMEKKI